jgi:NADPH:quinone reductase-like Zn-dependent oxidoreductase
MLTGRHRAHHGEIMREATALADAGSLKPRLDPRTFTLDSVADAHAAVEQGTAAGKVVVDIAQAPGGP